MPEMPDLSDFSNASLRELLEDPNRYTPESVHAAAKELATRRAVMLFRRASADGRYDLSSFIPTVLSLVIQVLMCLFFWALAGNLISRKADQG
jgi:hypothetical protein